MIGLGGLSGIRGVVGWVGRWVLAAVASAAEVASPVARQGEFARRWRGVGGMVEGGGYVGFCSLGEGIGADWLAGVGFWAFLGAFFSMGYIG